MKRKRIIAGIIAVLLTFLYTKQALGCTIFTSEGKDVVYAASNEDWMYSVGTYMTLTTRGDLGYGRVCFYNSSYVQAGMNEYGLFYDGASCPATEIPYDRAKEQLGYDLGEVVLASCTSVSEAVEFLESCNIPGGFYDHLLFADSTGDSVVLEWMENELHILRKGDQPYQLVTNYWLTDPSLGGYPCSRFDTAEELLQRGEPSVETFAGILDATKQDWGSGGTLYSGVYDLTNKEVYVFLEGDMKTASRINLMEQLKGMKEDTQSTQAINELSFETAIEPLFISTTHITSSPSESPKNQLSSEEPTNNSNAPDSTSGPSALWGLGLGLLLFLTIVYILQKTVQVLRKKHKHY